MAQRPPVDVLIVGSGPTGLVLAIELLRRDISCRLIDKRDGPRLTSRSFTVHAKTMEMLDDMGVGDAFLAEGIKNNGFIFNFKGKDARPTLDFSGLDTPHPYILVLGQNTTERLLREFLHQKFNFVPEWSTQLTELNPTVDSNSVTIRAPDDTQETINVPYVIGCDGHHSFVRPSAGLDFTGSKYEGMIMQMMDVKYDGFKGEDDRIHYHMSKDSFLLVVKLPGGIHRVIVSNMRKDIDPTLTQHQLFQSLIDGHVENTKLGQPDWATKWQIQKRLAERYSKANIFLAGDAVHVHSPSGGQGMNVGMQDAYNLGWKLALVVKGHAKSALLDTYERERKPVGAQVIKGTDAMHDVIMAHGKGMQDRLVLTQAPGWHDEAVNRISGLSYHYRNTIDVPPALALPGGLQPGDRAPDANIPTGGHLFDLLNHVHMTFLLIPTATTTKADIADARDLIVTDFPHVIRVATVESDDHDFVDRYGRYDDGHAYLIRPDGYVTLHCMLNNIPEALSFLANWLHKATSEEGAPSEAIISSMNQPAGIAV